MDPPDTVLDPDTPRGVVDLAGAGVPNPWCPERIAESCSSKVPGVDDGFPYGLADLYFNPPVVSFTIWLAPIPAGGRVAALPGAGTWGSSPTHTPRGGPPPNRSTGPSGGAAARPAGPVRPYRPGTGPRSSASRSAFRGSSGASRA